MSLLWKRYYFLWITLGLILIGLALIGSKRIFSYNFGQAINPKVTSSTVGQNISNPMDPFDDKIVHDIQIDMSDQLYQQMLDTYTELGEKEYFSVDVRIDGVLMSNVGVRLKGNSSLRGLGEGKNGARNGGFTENFPGGAERRMGNTDARENFAGEVNFPRDNDFAERAIFPGKDNFSGTTTFPGTRGGFGERVEIEFKEVQMMPQMGGSNLLPGEGALSGGNNFPAREEFAGGMGSSGTGYLPLMLKFDAFIPGQTYNGLSELSLRLGGFSDQTLLAEMLAYRVYQALDYPAPNTSYTQLKVGNLAPQLYVLSELVNKEYLERNYPDDDNGILYKNKSFYDFSYLGEDPSSYAEIFSQKTNKKKDDLAQLIKLIQFVNQSSDSDFEEHLEEYLDVDSVLYLMAIDSIIQNTDGFNNGRMNYYLYYSKEEKRFKILTWDQNLAFGGFGGGGFGGERVGGNAFPGMLGFDLAGDNAFSGENSMKRTEGNLPGFESLGNRRKGGGDFGGEGTMGRNGFGGNGGNLLRTRLLQSDSFATRYQEIFQEVHDLIYQESFLDTQIERLSSNFSDWNKENNVISQQSYQQGIDRLKQTILAQVSTTASSDISQAQRKK